jgi:hypothetical protein
MFRMTQRGANERSYAVESLTEPMVFFAVNAWADRDRARFEMMSFLFKRLWRKPSRKRGAHEA